MDAFIDLSWRTYPGGIALAVGLGVLLYGLCNMRRAVHMPATSSQPLHLMLRIRTVIFGIVVAGFAGSWIWHQLWLFVLALAFFGEELLETSIAVFALHRFIRLGVGQPAAGALAATPRSRL